MKYKITIVFQESVYDAYNVDPEVGRKSWIVDAVGIEEKCVYFRIGLSREYIWAGDTESITVEYVQESQEGFSAD